MTSATRPSGGKTTCGITGETEQEVGRGGCGEFVLNAGASETILVSRKSPSELECIPKGPSNPPIVTLFPHRPLLRSSLGCTREVLFPGFGS